MHAYLLRELYQKETRQEKELPHIMTIKKVVFKNYAPFADCRSELNNTQVDIGKGNDVDV